MAQNVGVQGVPFFVFDINMLFLELNTLKPCENIRESGKKAILNQNYCIELSK
jgi:predicted DsbA family dithiol-disulfide isomerase